MTLTIDEAIKRLEKILLITTQKEGMPDYDAIRLGFEALKREKEHRLYETYGTRLLLPGETKELKP